MGASRTRAGSFDELISAYYPSTLFSNRAPGTRKNRRIALEGFRKAHGTKPVAHLRTDLLAQIIDQKAKATPGAARDMLCALRELYKFAKLHGYASIDPTTGIPLPEIHSEGITRGRMRTSKPIVPRTRWARSRGWRWKYWSTRGCVESMPLRSAGTMCGPMAKCASGHKRPSARTSGW